MHSTSHMDALTQWEQATHIVEGVNNVMTLMLLHAPEEDGPVVLMHPFTAQHHSGAFLLILA